MPDIANAEEQSRFRLVHLFVITTVVASVAGSRWYWGGEYLVEEPVKWSLETTIPFLIFVHIVGFAFAGGLILAFDYIRFKRKLQYPGHWLVALTAIVWLSELGINTMFFYHCEYLKGRYFGYDFWRQASFVTQSVLPAIWMSLAVVATRIRFGKMWFATLCLFMIWRLGFVAIWLNLWSFLEHPITHLALLLAVLTSIGHDFWHGHTRDWLHWFGAMVVVSELVFRRLNT